MSTRLTKRQFRTEVFKGVFIREFHDDDSFEEQLNNMYDKDSCFDDIDIGEDEAKSIITKCKDIIDNVDALDKMISDNLDKWTINRIGKVELAILRVAVYEYTYDKLEAAIVINEAVDIAKIYGGDKSGSFINGVMAKIVR